MLDRTIAPASEEILHFDFKKANSTFLENGIPLHCVEAGTQEVLKLEILFNTGSEQEALPLASFFCIKLLLEGTKNHTAEEIANILDFHGAQIDPHVGIEYSSLNLYTINKHFEKLLDLLIELISVPTFPDKELKILKQQKLERIHLNREQTSYLAMCEFNKILFPGTHYGYTADEKDVYAIGVEECRNYFEKHLKNNFQIILSGKVDEKILSLVEDRFGKTEELRYQPEEKFFSERISEPFHKQVYLEKKDAVQSSLRIGRILFSKRKEEFLDMILLNTIIGGYFGSRLMKKIREEKGYTYGIHSSLVPLFDTGYWYITADVKGDKTQEALQDIYTELEKLTQKPISKIELEIVKNHLLGQLLSSIDNPFSLGDKFKSVYLYGLDYEYYENLLLKIKGIRPEELLNLANKYLRKEMLVEVVCGGERKSQ